MWTGDNLDIIRGMNSESVDLIYLDPPFNSNKNYSAPIGSQAAGVAFKDTWALDDLDIVWHGEIADKHPALYSIIDSAGMVHGKGMKSYLIMIAVRLLEMKRILKPVGSIYLHCDPIASHYLKVTIDAVFGNDNFRNEIIWSYQGTGESKRNFKRKHDVILFYAKSSNSFFSDSGSSEPIKDFSKSKFTKSDEKGKYKEIRHPDGSIHRQYIRERQRMRDVWDISIINAMAKERTGYPTQKPIGLLDRIIKASSNEEDVVFDPFCGCATTCVASEALNRQWVGIDLSPIAIKLVNDRLRDIHGIFGQIIQRTDIPKRTDLGVLPNYRTHKHQLYGKQEGICAGCLMLFQLRNMTVDHVVSQSKGGGDHFENLQLLCGACNSIKGDRGQSFLIAKLKTNGMR